MPRPRKAKQKTPTEPPVPVAVEEIPTDIVEVATLQAELPPPEQERVPHRPTGPRGKWTDSVSDARSIDVGNGSIHFFVTPYQCQIWFDDSCAPKDHSNREHRRLKDWLDERHFKYKPAMRKWGMEKGEDPYQAVLFAEDVFADLANRMRRDNDLGPVLFR